MRKGPQQLNQVGDIGDGQPELQPTRQRRMDGGALGTQFRNNREKEIFFRKRMSQKKPKHKGEVILPQQLEGPESDEVVKILKKDIKKSDTFLAAISFTGLVMAVADEEIFYRNNFVSSAANHLIRTSITLSCILLCNEFYVGLNSYITSIMMFRLYLILRLFNHYTRWTDDRSARICKNNGFETNSTFAIKCYLKYKSFFILTCTLSLSIFVFGIAVRFFERPFQRDNSPFDNLWNCFWNVIVTMTTIGYGDIYPQTHFGRLVIIWACIWGTFVLSLMVVSLYNITELTSGESDAFEQINRNTYISHQLQPDAKVLIQSIGKLKAMQLRKEHVRERFMLRMHVHSLASRYSMKRKQLIKEHPSASSLVENIQENMDFATEELLQILAPIPKIVSGVRIEESILRFKYNEVSQNFAKIAKGVLEVADNQRKLYSILYGTNLGERYNFRNLDGCYFEYDLKGKRKELLKKSPKKFKKGQN